MFSRNKTRRLVYQRDDRKDSLSPPAQGSIHLDQTSTLVLGELKRLFSAAHPDEESFPPTKICPLSVDCVPASDWLLSQQLQPPGGTSFEYVYDMFALNVNASHLEVSPECSC